MFDLFLTTPTTPTIKNMYLKSATGSICDISPMLRFHFCKPVYLNEIDNYFHSDINEVLGRFSGISKIFGHDMTFKILNISTNKIINRYEVTPADDVNLPNVRSDPLTSPELIKSLYAYSTLNSTKTASDDDKSPSSSK